MMDLKFSNVTGRGSRPVTWSFGSGAEAAVDVENGAGDERSFGARQKEHAGCDLFRPAKTLKCVFLALGFSEVAAVLRIHIRVDRARLHHVHGDAAGPEIARRTLGVADDGCLAGHVISETREGGAVGQHR